MTVDPQIVYPNLLLVCMNLSEIKLCLPKMLIMSNLCVSCRLAEEELLRESQRAIERSEVLGIEGFRKCPVPRTNKRFLVNTIVNNIKSNNFNESQNLLKRKSSLKAPHITHTKKLVCEKTDHKEHNVTKEYKSKK